MTEIRGKHANDRQYPHLGGYRKHPKFAAERRKEAAIRQNHAVNRSAREQLEILDMRLGKGVGAEKERARLEKML